MSIRSRNKVSAEFSSASISDIVFLLLIYFMLTSAFVEQVGIKVDLPTSSSDRPTEGKGIVTVTDDGIFAWNQEKLENKDDLIPRIEQFLEKAGPDNNVITLRVDKQALFEEAAFVMAIVAENDGKIVILTEKD
ncbi:MAG: biopolymer transporter ExbD [Bacteroidetes bacterium]|nr:biopolymer transporter ExbD [Bacteroidota bacterium]MCB0845170.1 biopolymer transporter ExbD [Bacteroidota bacterium]